MRIKIRYTNGSPAVILTIEDAAPVSKLISDIKGHGNFSQDFEVKHGFPPKVIDLGTFPASTPLSELPVKLNGEQLLIEPLPETEGDRGTKPADQAPASRTESPQQAQYKAAEPENAAERLPSQSFRTQAPIPEPFYYPPEVESQRKPAAAVINTAVSPNPAADVDKDPPTIFLPNRGTMVLRVMEDDNNCMFRALSYVCGNNLVSVPELRQLVATTIQSNPDVYTRAVLGKPVDSYCRWITTDGNWGGAIELGILADFFGIEIIALDVSSGLPYRFNEGRQNFVIVVYSGIHYDALALSPISSFAWYSEPSEDICQFQKGDEQVVAAARELAAELKRRRYFTDTSTFTLRCGVCGAGMVGQDEARKHALATGHTSFGEY